MSLHIIQLVKQSVTYIAQNYAITQQDGALHSGRPAGAGGCKATADCEAVFRARRSYPERGFFTQTYWRETKIHELRQ